MLKKYANEYVDFAIILLALAGMVFSHALMSFALAFMAVRTLFANKKRLKESRKDLLAVLLSYFALILVGILWSENKAEALQQLNKNLPFLIVPLYFFTVPLPNKKQTHSLAFAFVVMLVVESVIALIRLYIFDFQDIRTALPFGSHIRFALFVCCAIGFLGIYITNHRKQIRRSELVFAMLCMIYFVAYLVLSSSLTGIAILLLIILPIGLIFAKRHFSKTVFYSMLILICFSVSGLAFYVFKCAEDYFVPKETLCKDSFIENGYYCYRTDDKNKEKQYAEMAKGMQETLGINADSLFQDKEYKYPYLDIAVRYFNSKGLERNLENWNRLTDKDKENIRNGIPNYVYAESNPLKVRLYKTFFELESYRKKGKIKGSSIVQKLEMWHKSILLSKDDCNALCGVGTGDLKDALEGKLQECDSQLAGNNLKPHNQYLTIYVTFGAIGVLLFGFWLIYPAVATHAIKDAYYLCFFAIMLISMLSEDTLDNQQGIMFFCVLNSLLICRNAVRNKKDLPLQI